MPGRVEVVVFRGVKFRRYPDAPGEAERRYFVPGIADRQRGVKRLHEEVWIAEHGPIPDGHHVHHRDHDHLNNDPSNLEALPDGDHRAHHGAEPRSDAQRAHWRRVQAASAEWHRSDEGRAWHREHAREQGFGPGVERAGLCEQCGAEYSTSRVSDGERFCSNACRAAARRASGVDDVDRICEHCGGTFRVNRYSRTRYCGRSCAGRARAARA